MFERILVAIDDSDNARRAVDTSAKLAGEGSTIVVLHAYHVPIELQGLADQLATGTQYLDNIRNKLKTRADTLLAEVSAQLDDCGATIERLGVEGAPGPAILTARNSHDCECVVLGRRGRGRVKRLLVGSVSDYVIHHAAVPVIIVP